MSSIEEETRERQGPKVYGVSTAQPNETGLELVWIEGMENTTEQ